MPIAVGGLGGSGTRLVAEILAHAGIYMGADLNRSADNLWFTLLLKRPRWLARELDGSGEGISRGLRIFERAMLGLPPRSPLDLAFVARATGDMARHGHNLDGDGRGVWARERARSLLSAPRAGAAVWGWKEPATFLLIPHLAREFGESIRYVHVVRAAAEMASNRNQQDLALWGGRFGVEPNSPGAALRFWHAANEWALAEAAGAFGERFVRVEFEELCARPHEAVAELLARCGLPLDRLDELAELPDPPPGVMAGPAGSAWRAERSFGRSMSVVLCTYNGERYLPEQLDSLARQTRLPDELVVCDDGSTDGTIELVNAFAKAAPFKVNVHLNRERLGFAANFEQAVKLATGEVILLCDQDDVWHRRKLSVVDAAFASDPQLGAVFTDADLIDARSRSIGHGLWESVGFSRSKQARFDAGEALEILRDGDVVTGATLAFRSSFRGLVVPFPAGVVHDGWIALLIAMVSELRAIPEALIRYRIHAAQQIGVPEVTMQNGRRLAELARRTTKDEREAFGRVADQFAQVAARVRERAVEFPPRTGALETVQAKVTHFTARASVGRGTNRLLVVARELRAGRYHRFSHGWRSAAKDLLRTERIRR